MCSFWVLATAALCCSCIAKDTRPVRAKKCARPFLRQASLPVVTVVGLAATAPLMADLMKATGIMKPKSRSPESRSIDAHSEKSIKVVSDLEHEALARRTAAEAFSDFVVLQGGRPSVIALHAVWFAVWMSWNSGRIPGLRPFDPYPFMGLSTIVSLEAIFLSLFILVSQNRATRRADERAHLDLQINLMAERESTKMLQLLRALCMYHGLAEAADSEVEEMLRETEPASIARELEKHLPSDLGGSRNNTGGGDSNVRSGVA